MKKIITLVFSIGLLTSAFAQTDRRQQNNNRSNDKTYQSSPYSGNNGYENPDQYPYTEPANKNSQWDRRGNQYENNRFSGVRARNDNSWNRNYRASRRLGYHGNQRRYEDYPYRANRGKPVFQIIFGIGGHR